MIMSSPIRKLTALGMLTVWFTLLGIPLAEAFDADHVSPDASDHAIEKVFRLPALSPDFQAGKEQTNTSEFLVQLLEPPVSLYSFEGTQRGDIRLSLGRPPGPPGTALFKVFSTFRI